MGRTNCPASGLIVQVRVLLGLHCASSAVSFAVVRTPATPSVVLTWLLLNTRTIIVFGVVFLELFPAHVVFSGKPHLASCLISQTPRRREHHPGLFSPVLTAASTVKQSLGQVWLKRLEALAEVCEAKHGVRILNFLCYRVEFSNYAAGQLFWQPWSCFATTNPQGFFIIVTPWSSLSVFLQVSLLVPSLNRGWLLSLTEAEGGVPYCLGHR